MIPFRLEVAQVLGDKAALFVEQLGFWLRKCGREIDGKTWVYNSYGAWAKQLNCSPRTICSLTKKLRDRRIISTRHYGKKSDRTLWYALNKDVLVQLIADHHAKPALSDSATPAPSDNAKPAFSYIHKITTGEQHTEEVVAVAPTEPGKEKTEQEDWIPLFLVKDQEFPDLTNGWSYGGDMKASAVAESFLKKQVKPTGSVPAMVLYWKEGVYGVTGVTQKESTGKDFGQMKKLMRTMGDGTKEAIDKVLKDWSGFCKKVQLADGVVATPADPNLGFIVSHLQALISYTTVVKPVVKEHTGIGATNFTKTKAKKHFNPDAWTKPSPKAADLASD